MLCLLINSRINKSLTYEFWGKNMKKNTHFKLSLLAAAMCLATGANALEIKQQGNIILFDDLDSMQYVAKIRLPNGSLQTFKVSNGNFSLSADMFGLDQLQNGLYKYELTPTFKAGQLANDVRKLNDADISAEYAKTYQTQNQSLTGVFTIADNILADKNLVDSITLSNKGSSVVVDSDLPPSTRDQVILDDLIVDGSICAGFDCVNGESFGFDTLRLKENNLRIKFQDTSTSASFPTNDWQITANDSANGGQNKFSIDDIDGGRTPFTIEAGASSHSLYVDDAGRIGLGTNTPVVQVHVKDGNTPTLRLEQDGSDGFNPQTWDVAGNEANFFVRDASNGSTLPFRIRPGAPSSSIDIDTDGNIGIGTAAPAGKLHIENTAGDDVDDFIVTSDGFVGVGTISPDAQMHLENGGAGAAGLPRIILDNTDFLNPNGGDGDWLIDLADTGKFRISLDDSGQQELQLDTSGNLTVTGTITTATQTLPDYVFEKDYKLMKLDELKSFIDQEKHLPGVPNHKQVLVDQKGQYDMTKMQMAMLEKIEELTLYTLQQEEAIRELQKSIKTKK